MVGDITVMADYSGYLASTEMQRVPSLHQEKYLGLVVRWLVRPADTALREGGRWWWSYGACVG